MARTAQVSGEHGGAHGGDLRPRFPWSGFRAQAILLLVVAAGLYANTVGNRYALDDGSLVEQNEYVSQGIRGIPSILSTDSFSSLYRQMGGEQELSAGRYRPLSLVTFALERQVFGANPHVGHAVNVLLYLLTIYVLYHLLRRALFPDQGDLAFVAAFLFAIHPIHTEVVANIKSRDEILSLLFLLLTLVFLLRHVDRRPAARRPAVIPEAARAGRGRPGPERTGGRADLALSAGFYFLALLSKEYGLSFLVLIPMLLVLFRGMPPWDAMRRTVPFAAVAACYAVIRLKVVGFGTVQNTEILNNPYLWATPAQRWATKILVLGKYLRLLLWPWPLSSDYSYNQIPYVGFPDPRVWISVLVHLGIVLSIVILWRRRHWLAFAAAFYLLDLLLVSNLAIDIGATMGERLIYHASLGFALAAAFLILRASDLAVGWRAPRSLRTERTVRPVLAGLLAVLLALSVRVTIPRNAQWKDDTTLFLHDIRVAPNSVLVNGNAGRACVVLADAERDPARKKADLETALGYLEKATRLDPDCVNAWFYMGNAYDRLGDYDRMEAAWNEARARFPRHPNFRIYDPILGNRFGNQGVRMAQGGDYAGGAGLIEKALRYAPEDAGLWYRYGRVLLLVPDRGKAKEALERALELDPGLTEASKALQALSAPAASAKR